MYKYRKKIIALVLVAILGISVFAPSLTIDSDAAEVEEIIQNDSLINYITIDSSRVELDEDQIVVVGVGADDKKLNDATLCYMNESTGDYYCTDCIDKSDDGYKFKFNFNGCKNGVYRLTNVHYNLDDNEYNVDLLETGFDIIWGVGIDVITTPDAVATDEVREEDENIFSVVTKDGEEIKSNSLTEVIKKADNNKEVSFSSDKKSANGTKVVVLDPGHGGTETGACWGGLEEKNLNLMIAQACKNELDTYYGITTFMTRNDDSNLSLEDRCNIAAFWGADLFVSIHLNAANNNADGVEIYYPNGNYNPFACLIGYAVSEKILNNIVALGENNRGLKIRNTENGSEYPDGSPSDYYSVINGCKRRGITGIIVEHAFLDGPTDYYKLLDIMYLFQLGAADAKGIADYFGLGKWSISGIYLQNHSCKNFTCGIVTDNKSNQSIDYRWLVYDINNNSWQVVSDWTTNNPWLMWDPGKTGKYLIQGEARLTNNPSDVKTSCIGSEHNEYISGICQMPYQGGGFLLGETTEEVNPNLRYEIQILDCSKLSAGDPFPWIASTGRLQSNGSLWYVWKPQFGYYWTLFRIYDASGNLLDEKCFGFQNI